MYKYNVDEVVFSDGSTIQPGALTVIVGPNNSGKSRALRDIQNLCTEGKKSRVVVTNVRHSIPLDASQFFDEYKVNPYVDEAGNYFLRGLASNLKEQHNVHVGSVTWKQALDDVLKPQNEQSRSTFARFFGNMFVSMFSTEDRLRLIEESDSAAPDTTTNLLQAFYKEGATVEDKVREIVKEAFQKDIRLDFSALRRILIRIGDDLSSAPIDARDALPYYQNIEKLDDQGDGIRSFVGTVVTLLVGNRPLLLLDEPEAFLHPPQAFRLGEVIAAHSQANRQVIVATHSSELLRGILAKRHDLTIVRIDRVGPGNVVKVLPSHSVASFATDPLLSSTRILDGLFYKGAIIVEADADSVFYQRIGRQLTEADSYHVAHAHNKQTVAKVLAPYQSLGIPYAAIVDFDVIRVKAEFFALLSQFGFNEGERRRLDELQGNIVAYIERVSARNCWREPCPCLRSRLRVRKRIRLTPTQSYRCCWGI
jgi:predicted ATPase